MVELYEYQKVGAEFLRKARYAILGDEQGIGKTAQAITAMKHFPGINIVVCPAMLKGVWEKELRKWSYEGEIQQFSKRQDPIRSDNGVYIVSYDMLKFLDIEHRCIIFDECQYLKNPEAKRTMFAHGLVFARRPEACFCLSGTPIKNNANEFFSALRLMGYCPTPTNGVKIPEKSQWAFSTKFSYPRKRTIYNRHGDPVEITKFEGQRNLALLKTYLKGKYLRRLSSKVLDLPDMVHKEVPIKIGTKKMQASLSKVYSIWESGEAGEHIMSIKADNAIEKAPYTAQYAMELLEMGETSVIFTDHVKSCLAIHELLENKGVKVELIHGAVSNDVRDELISAFQRREIDILVCTIGAASTGFTLTATRNMIFNDISWNFVDVDQARKRIHRVSQDRTCIIHYLTSGDMDAMITDRVLEKEANLKKVL
jgi:SNF2 family DNA or RNA helicase